MRIVEPEAEIISTITEVEAMRIIEKAGRVCYKSENKINSSSAEKFIEKILSVGHESVIEHVSITARVICDRGVSHEIVRHRLASYSQESTRYCNYSGDRFGDEITVIRPVFWENNSDEYLLWKDAMEKCEESYFALINNGAKPEQARSVLPNSLKTEIYITMNFREWRYFFTVRCSNHAHPQMRQAACMLLNEFRNKYPFFVNDLKIDE